MCFADKDNEIRDPKGEQLLQEQCTMLEKSTEQLSFITKNIKEKSKTYPFCGVVEACINSAKAL